MSAGALCGPVSSSLSSHPSLSLAPCCQDVPAFFLLRDFSELYPLPGHLHMPLPRSGALVPPLSELVHLHLTCSQLLNSPTVSKTHKYTVACVVFDESLSPKLCCCQAVAPWPGLFPGPDSTPVPGGNQQAAAEGLNLLHPFKGSFRLTTTCFRGKKLTKDIHVYSLDPLYHPFSLFIKCERICI